VRKKWKPELLVITRSVPEESRQEENAKQPQESPPALQSLLHIPYQCVTGSHHAKEKWALLTVPFL
jgi:hypothetical protein